MSELKPCPFCGNDESVMIEKYGTQAGDRYRVICPECMANVDNGYAQNAKQAVKAWNRRENGKAAGR